MGNAADEGLSWLSDEEREGLDEDDLADSGATEEEGDLEEEDDAQEPAQSPPHEAAAVGQDEPEPAPFQPVYQAALPQDFQARVEALTAAGSELAQAYENGDFDLAEYQQRQRALSEQEWALRATALKAEMAREQQQQSLAQRWAWEQDAYFRKAENRAFRDDPVVSHAFEGALRLLAADENNGQRDMGWFLEEAGRLSREKVRELAAGMGMVNGTTGAPPARSGNGKTASGRGRASPPPSLGGMPTAAMPDPGGDEFAYLDRMGGLEAERAMAKLTPDQLDRYLAG